MFYQCLCGETAEIQVGMCPTCGRYGSFGVQTTRPKMAMPAAKLVTAKQLRARGVRDMRWPGPMAAIFPDGLPRRTFLVLYGPPGSGKSTLALLAADRFPGSSLYLSYEMGIGPQLASIVARHEISKPSFLYPSTWQEAMDYAEQFDLVVVDSLQASHVDPDDWKQLVLDQGHCLIVVSQVNAQSEVRGGMAASHICDISVALPEYGAFSIKKNRCGRLRDGRWN